MSRGCYAAIKLSNNSILHRKKYACFTIGILKTYASNYKVVKCKGLQPNLSLETTTLARSPFLDMNESLELSCEFEVWG